MTMQRHVACEASREEQPGQLARLGFDNLPRGPCLRRECTRACCQQLLQRPKHNARWRMRALTEWLVWRPSVQMAVNPNPETVWGAGWGTHTSSLHTMPLCGCKGGSALWAAKGAVPYELQRGQCLMSCKGGSALWAHCTWSSDACAYGEKLTACTSEGATSYWSPLRKGCVHVGAASAGLVPDAPTPSQACQTAMVGQVPGHNMSCSTL